MKKHIGIVSIFVLLAMMELAIPSLSFAQYIKATFNDLSETQTSWCSADFKGSTSHLYLEKLKSRSFKEMAIRTRFNVATKADTTTSLLKSDVITCSYHIEVMVIDQYNKISTYRFGVDVEKNFSDYQYFTIAHFFQGNPSDYDCNRTSIDTPREFYTTRTIEVKIKKSGDGYTLQSFLNGKLYDTQNPTELSGKTLKILNAEVNPSGCWSPLESCPPEGGDTFGGKTIQIDYYVK